MNWALELDETEVHSWARSGLEKLETRESISANDASHRAVDRGWYRAIGELGLLEAAFDLESPISEAIVSRELGRLAAWNPIFESVIYSARVLSLCAGERYAPFIEDLISGRSVCVAAGSDHTSSMIASSSAVYRMRGTGFASAWAAEADAFLIPVEIANGTEAGSLRAVLVGRENVTCAAHGVLMGTIPLYDVTVEDGIEIRADQLIGASDIRDQLEMAKLRYQLALSAFCVGGAEGALDLGVAYAKSRKQFGRMVGAFQAQQHKLANALIETTASVLLLGSALAGTTHGKPDASEVRKALLHATEAFTNASLVCSLLHGGYGFLRESEIAKYFVRSKILEIFYAPAVIAQARADVLEDVHLDS